MRGDHDVSDARILVCEGAETRREDLIRNLACAGFQVLAAPTARDLVNILDGQRVDLILCNTELADSDGMSLLHAIRENQPALDDVPILMLSAHSDLSDIAAGMIAGADGYLTLPLDRDILVATVTAHLRQAARIRCRNPSHAAKSTTASLYQDLADHFSFGIVLLDGNGQPVFMNAAARRITGRDLRTIQNWLPRRLRLQGWDQTILIERVGWAKIDISNGSQPAGSEAQPDLCLAAALRLSDGPGQADAIAVLLHSPSMVESDAVRLVAEAVGLTRSETAVAQLLAHGRRVNEIARTLSISRPTVTFHLQNIFRKTNTFRQADLVLLLHCIPLHQ